jgi:hypothetical protein
MSEIKDDLNTNGEPSTPPNVSIAPSLRFYFVSDFNGDGESRELFVWAESVDAVADHWRDHFQLYEYNDDEEPNELYDEEPDRIFEIPIEAPRPGPVGWYTPGELSCVFDKQGRGGARD